MGLDWVVDRKPTKGNETEFRKLQKKLNKAISEDSHSSVIKSIEKEINKISTSANETLKLKNKLFDKYYSSGYILDSELLDLELIDEACEDHTSLGCIDFANKLEVELSAINKEELNEDQLDEYDSIIEAIEWLKFWGTNGHGFSCSY